MQDTCTGNWSHVKCLKRNPFPLKFITIIHTQPVELWHYQEYVTYQKSTELYFVTFCHFCCQYNPTMNSYYIDTYHVSGYKCNLPAHTSELESNIDINFEYWPIRQINTNIYTFFPQTICQWNCVKSITWQWNCRYLQIWFEGT